MSECTDILDLPEKLNFISTLEKQRASNQSCWGDGANFFSVRNNVELEFLFHFLTFLNKNTKIRTILQKYEITKYKDVIVTDTQRTVDIWVSKYQSKMHQLLNFLHFWMHVFVYLTRIINHLNSAVVFVLSKVTCMSLKPSSCRVFSS